MLTQRIFFAFSTKKSAQSYAFISRFFSTETFNVDRNSTRHGGELVANVLKAHDVREVFTLCGGHISPILVSCEHLGINIYDTRHEVNAVFAADAVARLRQHIGVAAVTSGPGVTNTITALKNAQMAESPVILLSGAAPTLMKGRGALQDIDQMAIIKSLCKYTANVQNVGDIVPTLREAIAVAQSGTPGPAFVELPLDVLQPYAKVQAETSFIRNADTAEKKTFNETVQRHVDRQFHEAFAANEFGPLPVHVPRPDEAQLATVAELLAKAERPLLIMGSQAMLPPVKPNQLVDTVNKLGIPVYLGGMSRGLLGTNSPIQMRQNRKLAIKEADLVILAGAVCDFRLSYGKNFSPNTNVVSINRSEEQMLKNHGVFWQSAVALQADVALSLVALQATMADRRWQSPRGWTELLHKRETETEANNAKKMAVCPTDGHINPLVLLDAMDKVLPKDAILVADGGDFVGSAAYIVRPGGPLQWLDPGAFGTLGVGAGFALGAKAVFPQRPVVIIYGDGSSAYSLMEFDTFVRHKLPVIGIIGNDACWTQIAREQLPVFKSAVACDLDYTHYEQCAKALGTDAVFLGDGLNAKHIKEALAEAVRKSASDHRSVMINVLIGKTNFREGSISV
uniref:2-hydroxyacyl-CoA lyase 2 n=1 Tax=Globodera pallida TaxID=36090 RepID=A0A183BXR8_GLOPA